MAIKEMELVVSNLRRTIDLRKYQADITNSVQAVIPAAKVDVYQDYYVTDTPNPITNEEARKIGRRIASTCNALAKLVKEYRYGESNIQRSGQLFKKRK